MLVLGGREMTLTGRRAAGASWVAAFTDGWCAMDITTFMPEPVLVSVDTWFGPEARQLPPAAAPAPPWPSTAAPAPSSGEPEAIVKPGEGQPHGRFPAHRVVPA